MDAEPLLRADSIAKRFGDRRVLSSASLRAVPTQVRVLFGRNGAGKSTLMKIAAGRVEADGGAVTFDGATRLSPSLSEFARRGLFYLADEDLYSAAFSVRQQLRFVRERFSGTSVESAAERVGITDVLDGRPHELSGGERRRAELAAVIVRQPRCLVADEPYRGLSPRDAECLSSVFSELAASGCAVVLSGHEIHTLMAVAHHITWCTSGTTYELGTPDEARGHEQFRREYLWPRGV